MRFRLMFIFVLIVGSGTIFAQNDTSDIVFKKPMVNGHSFIFVHTTKSAFIKTYLNANVGIGSTGFIELPGLKIGDVEILGFTGNVAFANTDVTYQQKINDWLALNLTMNVGGRLGTSVSTILVDGVNAFSGGSIGWVFRMVQRQKLHMTGTLFVKNLSGSFINLLGYVNDIIDSVPHPAVVKNIPVLNVGIGVQGAWAINETWGLQFGADLSYGESFNRGKNNFFTSINLSGDMDLRPRRHIPLGFALGYMLTSNPEKTYLEFIYTNVFSGKIAYTGSSDFEIGLQFVINKVQLTTKIDGRPLVLKTQLDFKLYF